MSAVGLSYIAFVERFYHKQMSNFIICFLCTIEMIVIFILGLVYVVYHVY